MRLPLLSALTLLCPAKPVKSNSNCDLKNTTNLLLSAKFALSVLFWHFNLAQPSDLALWASVAAVAEEGRQISESLRGSQPAPRLPACDCLHVWTHPRGDASADHRLLFFLATKRLPVPSRPWARPWMSTLRFTAGVGVGSSGACTIGPVPKHHRFWVLLCAPTGCSLAISFLFSLLFLLVCSSSVEVTVTSSISHPSFVSHRGLFNTTHRSLGP